jgi:hypothetical protein
MGAALATAMKMTATMPIAPFFKPAGGADVVAGVSGVSVGAESVVTAGLLVRIGVRCGPATLQFRSERRTSTRVRQPEQKSRGMSGRGGN